MVNALGAYVQSVFANPMGAMTSMLNAPAPIPGSSSSGNVNSSQTTGLTSSPGDTCPVGFYFRGSFVPLLQLYPPLTPRPQL